MEPVPLIAGVEPGGLTNSYEIKILLCYLMKHLDEPITFDQLNEVFSESPVVNYFELTSTFYSMVDSGHITSEMSHSGEPVYRITPLGVRTADELASNIARSVRDKVVTAALTLLARRRRERETRAVIGQVEDGYTVTLQILDIGTDLLRMTLFVPDLPQAEAVREQFLKNPQHLYKGVLTLLTESEEEPVPPVSQPKGQI